MLRVRTAFSGMVGSPYVSTMHFTGDDTQVGADAAIAAVGAFWGAVDNQLVNDLTWATEQEVEIVDAATGQLTGVLNTNSITGTGSDTADLLARAAQGLIRWRTGVFQAGREVRGRTFVPGIGETANAADGGPSATFVTAVDAAADALLAAAGPDLAIWSRPKVDPVVTGFVTPVAFPNVWGEWAVLRSRRD